MPDREKVIKALKCCAEVNCGHECPYATIGGCRVKVLQDALALLREQETEYKPDGPDFTDGRIYTRWKCTSCQYFVCIEKGTPDIKYCPSCGRRVRFNADN